MSVDFYVDEARVDWSSSLNVANGNASAIVEMLGVPDVGRLSAGQVEHAILRVAVFPSSVLVSSDLRDEVPGRVTMIHFGRSPEQIESYRERLLVLLVRARRLGVGLAWG